MTYIPRWIENLKILWEDNKTKSSDHLNFTFHIHFTEGYHLENVFSVFVSQISFLM